MYETAEELVYERGKSVQMLDTALRVVVEAGDELELDRKFTQLVPQVKNYSNLSNHVKVGVTAEVITLLIVFFDVWQIFVSFGVKEELHEILIKQLSKCLVLITAFEHVA